MGLLWLLPVLPFLGALILAVFGGLLPKRAAGAIGCASVGLSFAISMIVLGGYLHAHSAGGAYHQTYYLWFGVDGLSLPMGLYLDQLSLVMSCTVAFVGFLIHLYSAEFMWNDEGYGRFFCYMNLFVGSMLTLLLADNFVLFYLGWEGVGLCSYLLIAFWYRDRANVIAGNKAFIITRIGDTALAIAFFILFAHLRTLDIHLAMARLPALGTHALGMGVCLLVIGGAIGKSAQLPLQTWLPDAMAGPTPVSALIHAATMVTAGVYLIARTFPLFSRAPDAMLVVAVIGAATAFYGAASALAQHDIKRVLAYSTISQIGYMFLALGVGAWAGAIFHFFTHAFFKALLFLSAGLVIQAQHEEHDIRKMGGLWKDLPVAGWTFLVGAASLSALPLITAGFYSKDAILWSTWASPWGSRLLWGIALAAAALTAIYAFRTFFLVFLGVQQRPPDYHPGWLEQDPVRILAALSLVAGFIGMPSVLGGFDPFGSFFGPLFGKSPWTRLPGQGAFVVYGVLASLLGIGLGYWVFVRERVWAPALERRPAYVLARQFLFSGWGFDWLYDRLFVRPYVVLARLDRGDVVDLIYGGLALLAAGANRALALAQSGRVRNYATALLAGAVLLVAVLLFR